jgi:hypothetical protein
MNIITGNWMSHAVCVVVQLGIPDLLAKRPCTAEELSSATECHGPTLARFMRALATLDICRERVDGTFEITALGALLQKDAPDSLGQGVPRPSKGEGVEQSPRRSVMLTARRP